MNNRTTNIAVRILLLVLCLLASTAGLVSCDFDELEYYDPESDTTTAETIPEETGPDYESVLIGSTYSALPLTSMTRTVLMGEEYSSAEINAASGTFEEVMSAYTNGMLDLVVMPFDPDTQLEDSVITPVAYQALVFYVSADNPIKSLTTAEITDIYSGKYIGWNELGGSKQQITAVQRGKSSAAQEYLTMLIGSDKISPAPISDATGRADTFDFSQGDIGCAVYSPELFAYETELRVLDIASVPANEETINNGTYPLMMPICAIYRPSDSDAAAIVEWMTSKEGQNIAATVGYQPINAGFDGYRYSVTLYNSHGTGGEFLTEETGAYYYTVSANIVNKTEDGSYKISGIKNAALLADINTFISESVTQLNTSRAGFEELLEIREYTGDLKVETECINGYLSINVRLVYTDGEFEYTYKQCARTYNLYTGKILEFSDLFYQDIDFSPELHRMLAMQALTPYDNWNSVILTKREFSGLPNSFGYSLTHIYFDIDNPFFYNGETFSLSELAEYMMIYSPRDMAGMWEDGLVTRVFRKYTPDGCEPEAVYKTAVPDSNDDTENLVYHRLIPTKLSHLETGVCDKINNAMYTFFKAELSPAVIQAKLAPEGVQEGGFYYLGMEWVPTFFGNSFMKFTCDDGMVEYLNSSYEYKTTSDFRKSVYFSLENGDYLTPAHIFNYGWQEEAVCRAYNADGTYVTLETPPSFKGIPVDPNADAAKTDDTADPEEQLLYSVMGLEILYDESGREVLIITAKEEFYPKYSYITISVPASFINWN